MQVVGSNFQTLSGLNASKMGWNVYDDPVLQRANSKYVGQSEKEVLADIYLQHAEKGGMPVTPWYSAAQSLSKEFPELQPLSNHAILGRVFQMIDCVLQQKGRDFLLFANSCQFVCLSFESIESRIARIIWHQLSHLWYQTGVAHDYFRPHVTNWKTKIEVITMESWIKMSLWTGSMSCCTQQPKKHRLWLNGSPEAIWQMCRILAGHLFDKLLLFALKRKKPPLVDKSKSRIKKWVPFSSLGSAEALEQVPHRVTKSNHNSVNQGFSHLEVQK